MKVPFIDLKKLHQPLRKEFEKKFDEIFETQRFILGPNVKELEESIMSYLGVKDVIGVASGTDSLLISLMALGIGRGDEVITTPFSFFATAGTISRLGAKPVFVDIDEKTFNILPDAVQQAITDKTKAIIPVHIFGQPCDMDPLMEMAEELKITVIEDACQAIGAQYKDRFVGSIGTLNGFSFFPTKNLGGFGDGGIITTNDKELGEKCRILRMHGAEPKYYHKTIGVNSRLDEFQAAFILPKLKHLDDWNEQRIKIAAKYDKKLKGIKQITLPYQAPNVKHIYHQYAILAEKRDQLQEHLNKNNIGAAIYYPVPLHLQECYADLKYKPGSLPTAEKTCKHILSLPIYPGMTDEQIDYVCEKVKEFYE